MLPSFVVRKYRIFRAPGDSNVQRLTLSASWIIVVVRRDYLNPYKSGECLMYLDLTSKSIRDKSCRCSVPFSMGRESSRFSEFTRSIYDWKLILLRDWRGWTVFNFTRGTYGINGQSGVVQAVSKGKYDLYGSFVKRSGSLQGCSSRL